MAAVRSAMHARAAIGVAGLPWNVPAEIEADLDLGPAESVPPG
jgi:hypothetical protein